MKKRLVALPILLGACAQTDIQPLTRNSFQVATTAAPACGPSGARKVANQAAAIEVIQRGGDAFVFTGADAGSRLTGVSYNYYGGFQTYNSNDQDLVVQMVQPGGPGSSESLSARAILGPNWRAIVAEGAPKTCT